MATENIMMDAVKAGGDRQLLHEKIRQYSMEAGAVVKQQGGENDLVDRIANDSDFNMDKEQIEELLKPINFVGRAPEQTKDRNKDVLGRNAEINV